MVLRSALVVVAAGIGEADLADGLAVNDDRRRQKALDGSMARRVAGKGGVVGGGVGEEWQSRVQRVSPQARE